MKFNKFLSPVQCLVVIAVLNTACGKYPEGPGFSLRSKAGRLEGEWTVTDVENEVDLSQASSFLDLTVKREGATMTFEREGDFSIETDDSEQISYTGYYGSYTFDIEFKLDIEGDWEWGRDKESIELEGDYEVEFTVRSGSYSYSDIYTGEFDAEFELLRLTNNEIIMEDEDRDEWELEKD